MLGFELDWRGVLLTGFLALLCGRCLCFAGFTSTRIGFPRTLLVNLAEAVNESNFGPVPLSVLPISEFRDLEAPLILGKKVGFRDDFYPTTAAPLPLASDLPLGFIDSRIYVYFTACAIFVLSLFTLAEPCLCSAPWLVRGLGGDSGFSMAPTDVY